MGNDLAVAGALQRVPLGSQLTAQLAVVVDLAVEDCVHGLRTIGDRLIAGLKIEHREPTHSQSDTGPDMGALAVRTAVLHDIAHSSQQLAWGCGASGCDARDPAHTAPSGQPPLAQLHTDLVAHEAQRGLQRGEPIERDLGIGERAQQARGRATRIEIHRHSEAHASDLADVMGKRERIGSGQVSHTESGAQLEMRRIAPEPGPSSLIPQEKRGLTEFFQ